MRAFADRRYLCRPFTLVEIVAVLAILGVLMGIGIGVYGLAMDKAKRAKTEVLIKKIEVTLENFKTKYGYYPQTDAGAAKNYHFYLDFYNMQGKSGAWGSDALSQEALSFFLKSIDYESMKSVSSAEFDGHPIIVDAWGNPLYYQCPGKINTSSFDLSSTGPNGNAGSDPERLYKNTSDSNKYKLNSSATSPPVFDTKTNDDITNY